MVLQRRAFTALLLLLALLPAWPAAARAEKKHPAEEKGIKSTNGEVETSIKFVNKSGRPVKVYWLDYEGQRKLYETVKDGDAHTIDKTYLTHPWLITDEDDNAWYVYFPDSQPRTVEITAPRKE
jgi:hypothetical protein